MDEKLIDRDSPIPLYQQIATDLINKIVTEEWAVGERIKNQNDLKEYYGVALVTVRQALALLEKDGLIVRQQGRGAFVTSNPKLFTHTVLFPIFDPTDDPSKNPITSSDIRIQFVTEPSTDVCVKLQIDKSHPVVHVQRLFLAKSIIIGYNNAWFPSELVPGLAEEGLIDSSISRTRSLRYMLEITHIDSLVESIKLNVKYAKLLHADYDASAFIIESVYKIADKSIVEYEKTLWLSKYTRLQFKVSK